MLLTVGDARIHYERAGAGFPVILLHAGNADSRMWELQVAEFAKHFDVIRPDHRGFGKSELPPERWSEIGDVLALMDELHLERAHLVGCSMGGAIAMDFALQHAERVSKLVLVGPAVGGITFFDRYPDLFVEVRAARKSGDVEELTLAEMHLLLDGPMRPHGYVKGSVRELFSDMNRIRLATDFNSAPDVEIDPPAAQRLNEITPAALVVIGEADAPWVVDNVALLMEKLPRARKFVIHDAGHYPNLEHPDEFNRVVLEFLLGD